jgi:hypothetical protein
MTPREGNWWVASFIALLLISMGWLIFALSTNRPFQSCAEASDAGASLPLHVGDPGWNATLDTDHDGSEC